MIEEKNKILGLAGEVFVESYCRQNKIKYKKSTHDEDILCGVDAYIDKSPTDVKNTNFIYICQVLENGNISVRHPFRLESKATHYCFVNVDATGQGKFVEHISIKEKLLRDVVKSEKALNELFVFLQKTNNLNYTAFGMNLNQACLNLKNEILKFCKPCINISYEEPTSNCQISFKISKKEEQDKKATISSINSIKELIKKHSLEKNKIIEKKENNQIITIKI